MSWLKRLFDWLFGVKEEEALEVDDEAELPLSPDEPQPAP